MSNTNKPLIVAVPLAIASWPWWTNLLLTVLTYFLFGYLAEPPLLMIPSGGEANAAGSVSFFQGEIWSTACTLGMYTLPALFFVAAVIDLSRIVCKHAR